MYCKHGNYAEGYYYNLWRYNMLSIKDFIQDLDNNRTIVKYEDETGHIFETTYNGIINRRYLDRTLKGGMI